MTYFLPYMTTGVQMILYPCDLVANIWLLQELERVTKERDQALLEVDRLRRIMSRLAGNLLASLHGKNVQSA